MNVLSDCSFFISVGSFLNSGDPFIALGLRKKWSGAGTVGGKCEKTLKFFGANCRKTNRKGLIRRCRVARTGGTGLREDERDEERTFGV